MASEDPQTARAEARVGQTLRAKWKLERLLGIGGMAAVYAATHRNGMRGAVKMLHPELSAITEMRERFLREGYAANRVDHPGVVRVLDDDAAEDGSVFLVMELLDGQTLDAIAEAQPGNRLARADVLAFADLLLDVLVVAHDKGIVHRDLKPENLFVNRQGELKVLDFGIARIAEVTGSGRVTQTGAAMGTPAFMPPEQASGQWNLVDARTDLWAVGATMFSLLTGQYVHEAPTVQLLMATAMTKPARRLASVDPSVPAEIAAIVDRALAFDRNDRFPDARTMQASLRAIRGVGPKTLTLSAAALTAAPRDLAFSETVSTTSPVSSGAAAPAARRSTGVAIAIGAGLAFVIAPVVWYAVSHGSPAHSSPTASAIVAPVEVPASTASSPVISVAPTETATAAASAVDTPSASPSVEPTAVFKTPAGVHGPRPRPTAAPIATSKPTAPANDPGHRGMY